MRNRQRIKKLFVHMLVIPIKWIICFSPESLKVFFNKKAFNSFNKYWESNNDFQRRLKALQGTHSKRVHCPKSSSRETTGYKTKFLKFTIFSGYFSILRYYINCQYFTFDPWGASRALKTNYMLNFSNFSITRPI